MTAEAEGYADTNPGAPEILLNARNPNENQRINLTNLKPGDTVYQSFALSVKNAADASIRFEIVRTSDTSTFDLAKKMNVAITLGQDGYEDMPVFQGTMEDFVNNPVLSPIRDHTGSLVYNLKVSLPEDMENDYQAQSFSGDLKWLMTNHVQVANPQTGSQNRIVIILSIGLSIIGLLAYGVIPLRKPSGKKA